MQLEQPCIDMYLPGERYDPVAVAASLDGMRGGADELALMSEKRWQTGQELRVRFLDGDAQTRSVVEAAARAWLDFANLSFVFGDHHRAELRITFANAGFWSYIGTDALQVSLNCPTICLGGLMADCDLSEIRRVVLHEFGHAIGCIHEHSSPESAIPWNEHAVYAYYRQFGWDDEKIYHNVLLRYSRAEVRSGRYDQDSIMQYPVPKTLTIGGYEVDWNTELSEGDKKFISLMYPAYRDRDQ